MNPYSMKKLEIREAVAEDYGRKRASRSLSYVDYAIERLERVRELLPKHYAEVELGSDDPDSGNFVYNDHYWDVILSDLEIVADIVKGIEEDM